MQTQEEFLTHRKINLIQPKQKESKNERMYWELYNIKQNLEKTNTQGFFSHEDKFFKRQADFFFGKEMHFACLDICNGQDVNLQALNIPQAKCMRNCVQKFQTWQPQLKKAQSDNIGSFLINKFVDLRKQATGYKEYEDRLTKRAEELKQKIEWSELNKPVYDQ